MTRNFLWINVCVLAVLLILSNGTWSWTAVPSRYFTVSGIISIAVFAILSVVDFLERRELSITQFFMLGAINVVGFGALHIGSVLGTEAEWGLSIAGHLPYEYLWQGLLLLQIAVFVFNIGFYLAERNRAFKFYNEEPFSYPSDRYLWLLTIVAWALKVMQLKLGMFGFAMQLAPQAVAYVFTIAAINKPIGKAKYVFFLLVIVFIELSLLQGRTTMREPYLRVLLPSLYAVAFMICLRLKYKKKEDTTQLSADRHEFWRHTPRKVKALFVMGIIGALFLFSVLFPILTSIKMKETHSLSEALAKRMEYLVMRKASSMYGDSAEQLKKRMSTIISSAGLCAKFQKLSVRLGFDPFQVIAAGFIPRIIWKDKPVIAKGAWFNKFLLDDLGRYDLSDKGNTAFALSAGGELFWAYGWAGFLGGMFCMGWITCKLFFRFFSKRLYRVFDIVVVLTLCHACLKYFESGFSSSLSLMLTVSVVAWGMSFFAPKPARKVYD